MEQMSRPAQILAVTAALLLPQAAAAYQRAEVDGAPGRYLFWPTRTLGYTVGKDGCKDVALNEALGAVKRAFFAWASPSCTDLYFLFDGLESIAKTSLQLGQDEDPDYKNVVLWRNTWPPAGVTDGSVTKEMPAVTTIIYNTDSGVVVDADIDLNGQDYFWTTTDDTTKADTDIENVVTHEVGHLLGLSHSDEKDATMHGTTHRAELTKRTLHADDILGLCTIYPFGKDTPKGSGQGSIPQQVQGGCQVGTGGRCGPGALVLLCALLCWRRRRAGIDSSGCGPRQ